MEFQDIRRVAVKISVLGLASGTLYLWAYWSKFGINVFSYAGILDLVNSAIIPSGAGLFLASIHCISQLIVSTWGDEAKAGTIERKTTTIWGTPLPLPSILDVMFFMLYVTAIYTLTTLLTYRYPLQFLLPLKLFAIPLLFAFVVQILMTIRGLNFLPEISSANIRSALIFTLLFAPPYAGLRGEYDAESVLTGSKSTLYEVSSGHKYVGYVTGYFFFLSPDNSKIIIRNAKFHKNLELTSFPSKNPPDPLL